MTRWMDWATLALVVICVLIVILAARSCGL